MVKGSKNIVIFIGSSALIGLGIAILFGILNLIDVWLWSGIERYNYSLSALEGMQAPALILMMPAIAGIVAAIYYYRFSGGTHPVTSAFSGAIAGFVLGVLEGIMAFLNILLLSSGIDANVFSGILTGMIFQPGYLLLALVSTAISSICAFVYLYIIKSRENADAVDVRQIKKENRMALLAVTSAILAVALLPQVFGFIGIWTGQIHESHSWYAMNVSVTRQGNDSIVLTNLGGPDERLLDAKRPFIVTIDDRDATNADAIKLSGLRLSIDPATGLGRENGSSVIYSGADLAAGKNGIRMVVVGIFPDGREQALAMENI